MGSGPTANGLVTESHGQTRVEVVFKFGYFPNPIWLTAAVISLAIAAPLQLLFGGISWLLAIFAALSFAMNYIKNIANCKYVLSTISTYLDSSTWQRE